MPANALKIRFNDREFSKTLREYSRISKRDVPTIVNTKAYYIARRATVETPAVSAQEIRAFMSQEDGRIAGMTINKRRGERGKKGLTGEAMAKMIATVKAARLRSRAFLKSGWIWAIKKLEPFAEKRGAPKMDRKAKAIGRAKGNAIPGRAGFRSVSTIINTVTAAWDKKEGSAKIAEPALKRAFDFERNSMLEYMERKMKEGAKEAGIKTR